MALPSRNFELGPKRSWHKDQYRGTGRGGGNIPSSSRRVGKATPWRSGRWLATSSATRRGKAEFKEPVDKLLTDLGLPLTALFSTLGRTAGGGALECQWAAHQLRYFQDKLVATIKAGDLSTANTDKWTPDTWPKEAKGVGFTEAPRGALGHWIKIKDGKIDNYQAVVPTTWNGSPRDPQGNIGAFEAALLDTPMADPEKPLENLRTLHSFDPCLACSTHVMGEGGQDMATVTVR